MTTEVDERLISHSDVHQAAELFALFNNLLEGLRFDRFEDGEWRLPKRISVDRERLEAARERARKLVTRMSSQVEWED